MKLTTEEAISALSRYVDNEYYTPQCQEARRMAIEALREQTERRWIPVTERMPDLIPCGAGTAYSEAVNVLTDGRKVLTAIWNGTRFLCDADYWEAWVRKSPTGHLCFCPCRSRRRRRDDG